MNCPYTNICRVAQRTELNKNTPTGFQMEILFLKSALNIIGIYLHVTKNKCNEHFT